MIFHTLDVNSGLSHNSVYSLFQDSRGYIWMGTADGLNRYDGRNVKVYRPANASTNAEATYIRDRLVEDRDGNIWYANSTGIYCWNKITGSLVLKKQLNNSSVSVYFLDNKGGLWLHEYSVGIICYNVYDGSIAIYPFDLSKRNTRLMHVATDDRKYCWFSVFDDGSYYRFDVDTKHFSLFRYRGELHLFKYLNDQFWLSDGKTIDVFNTEGKAVSSEKWGSQPFSKADLETDNRGRLWMAAYGVGLCNIDEKGAIQNVSTHTSYVSNTLATNAVTKLIVDRGGVLWVATDGGGVSRADLKETMFGKFPIDERDYPQVKDFLTWSIYENTDGKIWFGTNSGEVSIYDPVKETVEKLPIKLPAESHVVTICRPVNDELWIGYKGGVGYWTDGRLHSVPLKVPANYTVDGSSVLVYKILARSPDTLILTTTVGVKILVRSNSRWREGSVPSEKVLTNRFTDIVAVGEDLYVCCPYGGLYKLGLMNGQFRLSDTMLRGEAIRSIHRDELDGNILWLASKTGLWRLNWRTKERKHFAAGEGLTSLNLYGILEDAEHDLWISSNAGLICFHRKDGTFSDHTYHSGLQSNEFNSGSYHKGASGKLYFGGVSGFNWLPPKKTVGNVVKPGLIITGMTIGDSLISPYSIGKEITVPYQQNYFSITASVPDYTRPEGNIVMYKLEGWDKGWNQSSTGEIRYAHLPPGNHKLLIRPMASNKVLGDISTFSIYVTAPFWQQTWFRLSVVLGLVCIIGAILYFFHRRRLDKALGELEREKMLAAERNRISRDLHDDIGSAITRISLLSELIPMQNKQRPELMEDVKKISHTAREVSQSMSEIVWTLHAQHDTLESLLSYLREKIREFLEPIEINYEICFPEELPHITLTGEQRRNILLVTKEALNNAVKYASASIIRITCTLDDGYLLFRVEDDGKGFSLENMRENGNGLKNMHKRMEAIGGIFEIQQPEKGIRVVYGVKV